MCNNILRLCVPVPIQCAHEAVLAEHLHGVVGRLRHTVRIDEKTVAGVELELPRSLAGVMEAYRSNSVRSGKGGKIIGSILT